DGGLARAWRLRMSVLLQIGRLEDAAAAATAVVKYANAAGDTRLAARSAPTISYVLVHGPEAVAEGIEQCRELLEAVAGDRKTEAVILGGLAQLHAMSGDFEEARRRYRRGQEIFEELGAG